MRKKLSFVLMLVLLGASVAFATSPIDSLPPRDAKESQVEDVLVDPMAKDTAPPEIRTVPLTSKMDVASEVKPYDDKNIPKGNLPEPKSELQKLVFMFLKVLGAVVVCSLVLYVLLLFVRRFYSQGPAGFLSDEGLKDNLKSSQNESEALRSFLNKTKYR